MDEAKLRTLSVLVDNEAGILSQVSRLFSRKGFNIESLAVGPTDDPTISRITIEVLTNDNQTQLLCNQLAKMVPVHSVRVLSAEHSIRRESATRTKRRPWRICCGNSVSWSWCAPALWPWSGASTPFPTSGKRR